MSTPLDMTAETLNAVRGWPQDHPLIFVTSVDSTVPDVDRPIAPGSVVSLSPSKKFILGVGTSFAMPMYLFTWSNEPTSSYVGGDPATSRTASVPIVGGTAGLLALVAGGGYELVSTAYVAGEYPTNTPLTANKSGSANPGKLRAGTPYTDMIVGIVSQGLIDNGFGTTGLAFWAHPIFPIPSP